MVSDAVPAHLPEDDVFLTTEEVLDYLQVNLRTVYRLIKANKIPAVRVGRQWRFRRRDIETWLEAQRSAPGPAGVSSSEPHLPKRVLVVDDEPSIRELLSKTLALAEYEVDTAVDAPSALDRLRAGAYDLRIADLNMPGDDGLTLVRRARQLIADLPVIIITGFSSEPSAVEAVNLGVSGYLRKPFPIQQVLSTAARALAAR